MRANRATHSGLPSRRSKGAVHHASAGSTVVFFLSVSCATLLTPSCLACASMAHPAVPQPQLHASKGQCQLSAQVWLPASQPASQPASTAASPGRFLWLCCCPPPPAVHVLGHAHDTKVSFANTLRQSPRPNKCESCRCRSSHTKVSLFARSHLAGDSLPDPVQCNERAARCKQEAKANSLAALGSSATLPHCCLSSSSCSYC